MAEKREIRYKTTMDARDYQRGTRKVEDATSKMGQIAIGAQRRIGQAALNMGVDLARAAAQWAIDAPFMAESAAVVAASAEKVLGPAADTLRDKWSEMRLSMGLNIAEFDSLIARIGLVTEVMQGGDEAQGEFIDRLLGASNALAKFNPSVGTAEEVMDGLLALMRGEVDTIEKFGINLKKADIDERAAEMMEFNDALDEQTAFYLALVELVEGQAAPAFELMAESQDTAAEKSAALRTKSEDLQIQLGTKLLPLMIKLLDFVLRGIAGWEMLAESIGQRGFVGTLRILFPLLDKLLNFLEAIDRWVQRVVGSVGRLVGALGRIKVPKISLPSLPSFAGGGVVGGPIGKPQLAVVHGGESISGIGGRSGGNGGITVNVTAGISSPQETAEAIVDMLVLYERQNGALPFGGS